LTTPIEKPRDLVGGILMMALGAGFFLSARTLEFGTSLRMGPGYFPTILSVLLILLGTVLTLLALRGPSGEGAFGSIAWRGVLLVVGATAFFGLTMRGLGLAPVVVVVVLLAASASRYARLRTALVLAVCLAAFCSVLFTVGLGLPLPLFGPWLSVEFWAPAASVPSQ
jgi:hypothetical protein